MISADTAGLTSKGRATRARIIDAAAELIFQDGVKRTSLDDVGSVARVGKSQIYHYFPDKSALVGEVVARQTLAVFAAQQPFLAHLDTWSAWQSWRAQVVQEQQANDCAGGCPLGSIANEVADFDNDTRTILVSSFAQWRNYFEQGIVRMQRNGLIRQAEDAGVLASAVLAALQGGLLLCKTEKTVAPLDAALAVVIGYLRSLAPTAHATENRRPETSAQGQ